MLNTPLQQFVFFDKYARYNDKLNRRETWDETVSRVVDFLRELSQNKLPELDYQDIYKYILSGDVSPSMRLMRTAGEQARRHPESVFNCAFVPIQSLEAMAEVMWLSMCGVGVGYHAGRQYIDLLPPVSKTEDCEPIFHVIEDSAEGWVKAFLMGLMVWWSGAAIEFDYSQIRPAGAILKTKGGTASGPGVLIDLMNNTESIIRGASGRKLKTIEAFDIVTNIGNAAASGGSRRSAQLTMFDFDDIEMRKAKIGRFWEFAPNRVNANISVSVERELTYDEVKALMLSMLENGTGEPGITSRLAANNTRPQRRRKITHGGVNACAEINLQGSTKDGRLGGQTCNLSTVQVYPHDTKETLANKVRVATLIGTIQSIASDGFTKMLRSTWKEICAEERLLGVSLTGLMDNPVSRQPEVLRYLREIAIGANAIYAHSLGIAHSAAITTLKPSGNSSVMYGTARGINARYAPYYIRRVRVNKHTPIYRLFQSVGLHMHPEVGYTKDNANTFVAEFYEKSPDGAVTIDDMTALDQLEMWKNVKLNWCEHNPSVTIEYRDSEIYDIINWVFDNQTIVNGISFLPRSDSVYELAPYEEITKEQYEQGVANFPEIDFSRLADYENNDTTTSEIECSAGVCDLF